MAAGEFHLIKLPDLQPLGKRVDDRRADTVQTAGDLIAPAAEFAARVQDGIDDLQRGLAGLLLEFTCGLLIIAWFCSCCFLF